MSDKRISNKKNAKTVAKVPSAVGEVKTSTKLNIPLNQTIKVSTDMPPVKVATQAELIWNDIKDAKFPMFGMKDQTVADYCNPVWVDPSKCFLTTKASSALPLLEEIFADKYAFEAAHKYIVVSRKV